MEKIIFFGNGKLAEYALGVLEKHFEIIFHAREKADLEEAVRLKAEFPEAHGILASFGVLIPGSVLEAFEPEGILNIHPSLLPKYRGASPIESAILNGGRDFSVSVMKLVKAMDAGPIYYQATIEGIELNKEVIYRELAEAGAKWIAENLTNLPEPSLQDDSKATFTKKFTKADGVIDFKNMSKSEILRKIVAFHGFPKAKGVILGVNCTILEAHLPKKDEKAKLIVPCLDGEIVIDRLQPDGKKEMDAKSFLNGHGR